MVNVTNVPTVEPARFRKIVLEYRGLPSVAALLSVATFIAAYAVRPSFMLAGIVAAVSAAVGLWKWSGAGRQIDRWGCPICGQPFPRRLYLTTYPPRVCPACGKETGA